MTKQTWAARCQQDTRLRDLLAALRALQQRWTLDMDLDVPTCIDALAAVLRPYENEP